MTYKDLDAFSISPHVRFQQFVDEGILVDLDTETIFSLNATGAFIVTAIAAGQATIVSMREAALQAFAASEDQLTSDIFSLIDTLLSQNLIKRTPPHYD